MAKDIVRPARRVDFKKWVFAGLILSGVLLFFLFANPFDFKLLEDARSFLGINRKSASEIQAVVAGRLEGRRLLADATREYTGDFILEKQGGPLNCAGEQQFINDGVGTARVIVPGEGLKFVEDEGQIMALIPEPRFDSVDLKEGLDIDTDRNPCVRIVQLFGNVTGESEVREKLRQEIEKIARSDKELEATAKCNAKAEVESILTKAGIDSRDIDYRSSLKDNIKC